MAHATERTAPAILSAGATVIASMLVLTLADFKATQTLGPSLALGVAVMLLAGLTLLPALLLSCLGRNAFWPSVPSTGVRAEAAAQHLAPGRPFRPRPSNVRDRRPPSVILVLGCARQFQGPRALSTSARASAIRRNPSTGKKSSRKSFPRARRAATNIVVAATAADAVQQAVAQYRRRGRRHPVRPIRGWRPRAPRCDALRAIRSPMRRTISFPSFARRSGAQPEPKRRSSAACRLRTTTRQRLSARTQSSSCRSSCS